MKTSTWRGRIRSHRLCRQAQREPDQERAQRLLEKAVQASGPDTRPLLGRARLEFDRALQRCGMTVERIRAYEARTPSITHAATRIEHHGFAGSAANYVAEVASRRARG